MTFNHFCKGVLLELKINSGSWKRRASIISYRIKFLFVYVKPNLILLQFAKLISLTLDFLSQSRSLPAETFIGYGLRIPHGFHGVYISQFAVLGKNITLFHNTTIGVLDNEKYSKGDIMIGDDVYFGCGTTLLGKCKVGNKVKFVANSLWISKEIPDNSLVLAPHSQARKQ